MRSRLAALVCGLLAACSVDTRDIAFRPDSEFGGVRAGTGGTSEGSGGGPTAPSGGAPEDGCGRDDEGSARCTEDGELELCKAGTYEVSERCRSAALCSAIRKSCLECEPGTFRCTGDTLEQCNLEGAAFELVDRCNAGACEADGHAGFCRVCVPGTASCEGFEREFVTNESAVTNRTRRRESLRVCNDDGSGTHVLEVCALETPVCDSEAGRCVACKKGELACIGGELSRCSEDGTDFELVEDCGRPELCDAVAGACARDECAELREEEDPSALIGCHGTSGTELSFCAPSGRWEPLALCDSQSACEGGTKARMCLDTYGTRCLPGTTRCEGDRLLRCAEFGDDDTLTLTGGTWFEYASCASSCEEIGTGIAECVGASDELYTDAYVCTPGERDYVDCSSGSCTERSCPAGEICAGPELGCRRCIPGNVRCADNVLVRCDEDGARESVVADCGDGYCDRVRETCLPARPGETLCSQGNFSRVEVDGKLRTLATCGSEALCSPEGGCQDALCVVGSPSCEADERGQVRVSSCPDGTKLTPTQTRCESRDLCEDGLGCVTAYRVAAGDAHTCALVVSENHGSGQQGLVKCWGANESGQLGNGSPTLGDERTARPVVRRSADGKSLRSSAQFLGTGLCAGRNFSCADSLVEAQIGGELKLVRGVVCWGNDERGQLGIGGGKSPGPTELARQNAVTLPVTTGEDAAPRDGVPDPFTYLSGVTCGADFACALDDGGTAWCWGANEAGQLGIGAATETPWPTAQRVDGGSDDAELPTFKRLLAGSKHVCALDEEEALWCWGKAAKAEGTESRSWGVPERLGFDVREFAIGRDFALFDAADEGVSAFGQNFFGQLATSTNMKSTTSPVRSAELEGEEIQVLFGGPTAAHACALINGSLACWGANSLGQLGDGTTLDHDAPVIALEADEVEVYDGAQSGSVALGRGHTCAVDASGGLWCWGANQRGQLGAAVKEPWIATPTRVLTD